MIPSSCRDFGHFWGLEGVWGSVTPHEILVPLPPCQLCAAPGNDSFIPPDFGTSGALRGFGVLSPHRKSPPLSLCQLWGAPGNYSLIPVGLESRSRRRFGALSPHRKFLSLCPPFQLRGAPGNDFPIPVGSGSRSRRGFGAPALAAADLGDGMDNFRHPTQQPTFL